MTRLFVLALVACASCPAAPDVPVGPLAIHGQFAIKSRFALAAVPGAAAPALATLADATDGPDDPSRYLVDRLIAALPDGEAKTVAHEVAPLLAAYLQLEISEVAPSFVPGTRAIAAGLLALAREFTTLESWTIAGDGSTAISITGIEVSPGGKPVDLALPVGAVASTQVAVDPTGGITTGPHTIALDYGQLLRLGLDHAVIPSVDPAATDLGRALHDLVDCTKLGARVAAFVGFGAPSLYATACDVGLSAAANELYARLPASTAVLSLARAGAARGFDSRGDRVIDTVDAGTWSGSADGGPLGGATFTGAAQPITSRQPRRQTAGPDRRRARSRLRRATRRTPASDAFRADAAASGCRDNSWTGS